MAFNWDNVLKDTRRGLAEFFATGFLVFYIVLAPRADGLSAAFNLGFAIWLAGPLSGGHVNPIVTFMMLLQRKTAPLLGLFYIIMQIAGSTVGALVGKALVQMDPKPLAGLTTANNTVGMTVVLGQEDTKNVQLAFCVEAIAAFYFALVILSVTDAWRSLLEPWRGTAAGIAAFLIGFSTIPATAICKEISSGSLNPARSLGPAIANGNFEDQWVFIVAPFIGAFMAVVMYSLFLDSFMSRDRMKNYFTCQEIIQPPSALPKDELEDSTKPDDDDPYLKF